MEFKQNDTQDRWNRGEPETKTRVNIDMVNKHQQNQETATANWGTRTHSKNTKSSIRWGIDYHKGEYNSESLGDLRLGTKEIGMKR
jgi:hypothetical protein